MTMPFYVAPEQFMKDKADFARKNIARGRPLVGTVYDRGVLICGENSSRSLHKVSEIYDRIAFAGVGKYNEFDQLRVSGVQAADLRGYQFSREDVDARSLANLYARYMGNVFTHEMKPLEVEILVAEVGPRAGEDQLFHILYDGTVVDEERFTALGGESDAISDRMERAFRAGWPLPEALTASVAALGGGRPIGPGELEVAVLERSNGRRAFRRIVGPEIAALLGRPEEKGAGAEAPAEGTPAEGTPAEATAAEATPAEATPAEQAPADGDEA
ncbi:MAG: proteasome subunit alpha [Actinomycetota bacterium]|jgi:proteasome alpha subunit|nr:proteasome subunit alpha [Actinomycetota bacterium]